MPLVIGDIHATITVLPPASAATAANLDLDPVSSETERRRTLDAVRLDAERRVDQRDPDLLGGA